jgi:hypothetical protein
VRLPIVIGDDDTRAGLPTNIPRDALIICHFLVLIARHSTHLCVLLSYLVGPLTAFLLSARVSL